MTGETSHATLESNVTVGPFPGKPAGHKSSVAGLEKLLEDAEYLLDYAAGSGIELDEEMVKTIVAAEAADKLDNEETVKAIAAVTALSAALQPVTAKTLRACKEEAERTVKTYRRVAIVLGLFLLVSSIFSFVTSRLSAQLEADITVANELAISLNAMAISASASPEARAQVNADTRATTDLQLFLSTIRDMHRVALRLNALLLAEGMDLGRMEVGFPVDIYEEVRTKLPVFQAVRSFAKDAREKTALYYGALSNLLLPPLYAILGACAYLLRSFSEQVKTRTFTPSRTDSARFIIAAIGGGAVGLFNNFTLGESFPPLAIAFLVGYATDIFFSFLDRLQQSFTKGVPEAPPRKA
jgi:hypothetical protein